jgi:hypothetical protein
MAIVEVCDECGCDDGEILMQCVSCYDKRHADVWLCPSKSGRDCLDIHEANEHA